MRKYDIPDETAKGYIDFFLQKVLAEIKKLQPDFYDRLRNAWRFAENQRCS